MLSEAQNNIFRSYVADLSNNYIDSAVQRVVSHLTKAPYRHAADIAKQESLTPHELNAIYKIIQSSDKYQRELKRSNNRDYFDTVKNHFGKKQYTVVFFVGLYCPARCHFCPSVEIHENGYRELFRFKSSTPGRQKLSYMDFERIFADLEHMQKLGTAVNVKISGGLEPFTDPKTIGWILDLANRYGINSTIFTNGMLLKLAKNRELALKSDNIRISLSTSNEDSYNQAYYGDHKDNKKVVTLSELNEALKTLISKRNESGSKTRIGINTVAGEFNFHELKNLIMDASSTGVDYIEIKGEYFEKKNDNWFDALDFALQDISQYLLEGRIGNTGINLTGSLNRDNFFNNIPKGSCLPQDQVAHKLFINPFGECTPVHYWAYPSGDRQHCASQFMGAISEKLGLLDIIYKESQLPVLDYTNLNPFELILSLESERLRRDRAYGVYDNCNPYLSSGIHTIENYIEFSNNEACVL